MKPCGTVIAAPHLVVVNLNVHRKQDLHQGMGGGVGIPIPLEALPPLVQCRLFGERLLGQPFPGKALVSNCTGQHQSALPP